MTGALIRRGKFGHRDTDTGERRPCNHTGDDWSNVSIERNNEYLTNATCYYYSETEPALNAYGTAYAGNYWHYDENGEILIWAK